MAFNPRGRFTSKAEAMSRAKTSHFCTACMHNQKEIFKICPACGAADSRVYFRSAKEQARGAQLILLQRSGAIRNLKFLPKYDLVVNGKRICGYEADASYEQKIEADSLTENSSWKAVVEDTKPSSDFMTDVAKLKISLFNALYPDLGPVRIVR